MDYSELLEDARWKNKRQKIVKRDLSECRSCNNDFLKEDFTRAVTGFSKSPLTDKTFFIPFLSGGTIRTYNNDEIISALSGGEFYVIYYEEIGDNRFSKIYGIQQLQRDNASAGFSYDDVEGHLKKLEERVSFILANLDGYVSNKKKLQQAKWTFVGGLHVHHTYYEHGIFPWEYPDSSLETYCWKCHEKIHAETRIPIHDKNGNLTDYLNPCSRCSGAGYFPEYRHIEAGICFRCRGARYEELIARI